MPQECNVSEVFFEFTFKKTLRLCDYQPESIKNLSAINHYFKVNFKYIIPIR